MKRLKRTPGQTDVRLNSSTRQLASDPRSQTAEPQNNKCDVAASCPHSILVKRLECCADRLNPPSKSDLRRCLIDVRSSPNCRHAATGTTCRSCADSVAKVVLQEMQNF